MERQFVPCHPASLDLCRGAGIVYVLVFAGVQCHFARVGIGVALDV